MKKVFLIAVLVLLLPVVCWGDTYYVSSSGGSDSNNGTSDSTPWKTINKVNIGSFNAGDSILFNKGDTWREMLIPPSSGSLGNPIIFSSYGSGDDPKLYYDINRLSNSGWEDYAGTLDDSTTDTFTGWTNYNADANDLLEAVSDSYLGNVALKLTRTDGGVYIRRNTGSVSAGVEYTLSAYVKKGSGSDDTGVIYVYDNTNGNYLRNDSSWGAGEALTVFNATSTSYTEKSITFTTQAGVTSLRIQIQCSGNADVYFIDSIWIGKGASRQSYVGEISTTYDWAEIVYVSSKNYVTIDGLDIQGSRSLDTDCTSDYLVNVDGTSDNVIIQNCEISQGGGSIGIRSANTTSNVTFYNNVVHNCMNTCIYGNSDTVMIDGCTVYNCGNLATDTGDMGGIGSYQGNDVTIKNCEVYNIGQGDDAADFAISIIDPDGYQKILHNYIHDVNHGGIQVVDQSAGMTGALIAFNIISDWGNSTANPANPGTFAGIRLGFSSGYAPNSLAYNNVIAYGPNTADDYDGAGIYLEDPATDDAIIKNNIFYENADYDVYCNTDLDGGMPTFAYNYYYKSGGYTGNWSYEGSDYDTVEDWITASGASNESVGDQKMMDPTNGNFKLQTSSPCINSGTDPFSDGNGDQYDFSGLTVWSDDADAPVGTWDDGVEIGAYGAQRGKSLLVGF